MSVALNASDADQAWTMLCGSIEGAEPQLDGLRIAFVWAVLDGRPMREFDKLAFEKLAGVPWKWSWLEYWINRFEAAQLWPKMWPAFSPSDQDGVAEMTAAELAYYEREQAVSLIGETALSIAYRMRDQRHGRLGHRYVLVLTGDPAEDFAANSYIAAIRAGDYSAVPPFFPGDRTSLRPAQRSENAI